MSSTIKKAKSKLPQRKKNKKVRKSLASKITAATRLTVDDPVNDIFDDEIFDETIIPDENIIEYKPEFEQPW